MTTFTPISLTRSLVIAATATLFAACAADAPVAPDAGAAARTQVASLPSAEKNAAAEKARAIATLLFATARYHDLDVAKAEGFVFLHGCENRPGEGPVGTVYYHPGRLMDGIIDPARPDALIYEPRKHNKDPRLVGVELAVPYPLWSKPTPPEFLGASFQREDEFGVFGLHVWIWKLNPEGLFAESNPRVSCSAE